MQSYLSIVGCLLLSISLPINANEAHHPVGLPPTAVEIDLVLADIGKHLFFDTRLSADGTISCASCHQPSLALTDGKETAIGVAARRGTRNAPSLFNVRYQKLLFWDGREATLEMQARRPLTNPLEHGLVSEGSAVNLVRADPSYVREFQSRFQIKSGLITIEHVTKALAEYERTLVAGDSPFDRYLYGKEASAMSASAIRGMILFRGRAGCASCHVIGDHDALFTDLSFHSSTTPLTDEVVEQLGLIAKRLAKNSITERNTIISADLRVASLGRFVVTLNPADIGKFKTPSLRNVGKTAPYMHDGSVAVLTEAIDQELYSRERGMSNPIVLNIQERLDLIEFLSALSSPD